MKTQSCMRCYVSGKVQGVWYRATAQQHANNLGITGWARNLPDGRVEVFACGASDQLDIFYSWLQQGPRLARVDECMREDALWTEYKGFDTF